MLKTLLYFSYLLLCAGPALAQPLTVHEWGTFTSLQDEQGHTIGGINVDDEPVPKFVKRIKDYYLVSESFDKPWFWSQGASLCFEAVNMRLETPVIYFYPAANTTYPPFNVQVDFKQGWLTEYYPATVKAEATGFPNDLSPKSNGVLQWSNIRLGDSAPTMQTDEHVWLAPRQVSAASVIIDNVSEKYLFYRGVANLNAPLRVVREDNNLFVYSALDTKVAQAMTIKHLWLVDIRPDGKTAFRQFGPVTLTNHRDSQVATIGAGFSPDEYRSEQLQTLKASMQRALEEDGLYPDEAAAMLETWKLSYFKSGGTRLFYMVPETWTNYYLPLQISIPHNIKRVMVGRLELLNPRQRASLDRIATLTHPKEGLDRLRKAFFDYLTQNQDKANIINSENWWLLPMPQYAEKLRVELPESYSLFLELGRFRDALIPYAAQTYQSDTFKDFPTTCYYATREDLKKATAP